MHSVIVDNWNLFFSIRINWSTESPGKSWKKNMPNMAIEAISKPE